MRVYFDSSALVKVWLAEEGASHVLAAFMAADLKGTSLITFTECQRAIWHAGHTRRLIPARVSEASADFTLHWPEFTRVRVNESLVRAAALLAARHRLRTLDALHLASAYRLREEMPDEAWLFAAHDKLLCAAAQAEGFVLL